MYPEKYFWNISKIHMLTGGQSPKMGKNTNFAYFKEIFWIQDFDDKYYHHNLIHLGPYMYPEKYFCNISKIHIAEGG